MRFLQAVQIIHLKCSILIRLLPLRIHQKSRHTQLNIGIKLRFSF